MSWSVSAEGKSADVAESLSKRFEEFVFQDDGECGTVRLVGQTIKQCLGTFGPDRNVKVTAYGHMGYSNWDTKKNPGQNVHLKIEGGV